MPQHIAHTSNDILFSYAIVCKLFKLICCLSYFLLFYRSTHSNDSFVNVGMTLLIVKFGTSEIEKDQGIGYVNWEDFESLPLEEHMPAMGQCKGIPV